jgi:hypothetical protein
MISLPRPVEGSGVGAWATAAAMSASTAGRARISGDSMRMKRFWVPLPSSRPWGSGSVAPR